MRDQANKYLGRTAEKVHYTILNVLDNTLARDWNPGNLAKMKEAVFRTITIMRDYRPEDDTFKWAGFQVVLSISATQSPLSKERVEDIKHAIDIAVEHLRAFHVKPSYYSGVLRFYKWDKDLERRNAAGTYNQQEDSVSLNVGDKDASYMAHVLIHELAHRVWYRLPSNARHAWEVFINALSKPIPSDVKNDLEVVVNARTVGDAAQEDRAWNRAVAAHPVYARLGVLFASGHHISQTNYGLIAKTIISKGRTDGLPTLYAETTPVEAFPDMFRSMLGLKRWDDNAVAPLITAIMRDILSGLREAFELRPSEQMPTDPEFHPELLRDMVDEFNRTFGANSAGVHPIDFISKQMSILGHYSVGPARAHIGAGKSFGTSVFTGLHEMGHHYFNTVVVKGVTVPPALKKAANALEELFCDEVAVRLGADLIDTWSFKGKAPKDAIDSFKKEVRTEVWDRNVLQTVKTQAGENANMADLIAAAQLLGKDPAFQTSVVYTVFAGSPASAEVAAKSIGAQWKVLALKGGK